MKATYMRFFLFLVFVAPIFCNLTQSVRAEIPAGPRLSHICLSDGALNALVVFPGAPQEVDENSVGELTIVDSSNITSTVPLTWDSAQGSNVKFSGMLPITVMSPYTVT